MAEENAPEHQDRGLFGMFGKKKEEETHQQHGVDVDPHGHGHVGEAHPAPVSYGDVEGGKLHGEGEEKKHEGGHMGKLHRSNSSSSSSSSEEEEDQKGEKKKKKKGGLKDKIKLPEHHDKKEEEHDHGEQGEKKGLMDKIKEKLPGHNKEEEKEY
ncbi:dehydrin COR47-like [Cryptomeria japonica]|uniref:dehydrin COR47-like n=1 Tax=Cryptomeria japonica TaxID=3369 RepID=UPI0027DA97EA|nr:dehydrin COR47-like [Cryptomeria japonica]